MTFRAQLRSVHGLGARALRGNTRLLGDQGAAVGDAGRGILVEPLAELNDPGMLQSMP